VSNGLVGFYPRSHQCTVPRPVTLQADTTTTAPQARSGSPSPAELRQDEN